MQIAQSVLSIKREFVQIFRVCGLFYKYVSSRTCVKDVQYESTFLTVMTLRRLLWMPSRNNVT